MYSYKDFTGQNLRLHNIEQEIIERSCFSQEKPDMKIFPDDMKGKTFLNCNLDNVFIPPGNITKDCSQRRFMAQDDGYDWILDENNNPIERVN